MVKWRGRQGSSNIEDRRTQGGGLGGGFGGGLGNNPFGRGGGTRIPIPMGRAGGGIGGIIGIVVILGIIWFATGQNPLDTITGGSSTAPSSSSYRPAANAGEDELGDYVSVIVRDTENFWTQVFQQNNQTYDAPAVVLFTQQTQSGCGVADARSGPFYCPNDQKVYIDLGFYDQLRQQFGAAGDFAQAYVIAHEVGHHVQNLTGTLGRFNEERGQMSQDDANQYSVRVELQADCYAGVWANYMNQENFLEQGDTEEAINAANAIGDDTLTRGQVAERNFTHGTSEQRMKWLRRGMDSGDVGQCDTFNNPI